MPLETPRPAFILGYAGLSPAVALCLVILFSPEAWGEPAMRAHAIYAATILSFIGGAWWGLASARPAATVDFGRMLVAAVVPSLLAWPLAWFGSSLGLVGLGLLFVAILPVDMRLARAGIAPTWWMSLRLPLSLGMALLAVTAGLGD